MRFSNPLAEISIKVPRPFEGVSGLGFSARYPGQTILEPLRDVPLWIEGPAEPLRRLANRLRMLAAGSEGAYAWTDPIMLTDEVVVMAFHDRSLDGRGLAEGGAAAGDYLLNLVRPVVFPFLHDCAEFGHLRLEPVIEMSVHDRARTIAELTMRLEDIVDANGEDLLSA